MKMNFMVLTVAAMVERPCTILEIWLYQFLAIFAQ